MYICTYKPYRKYTVLTCITNDYMALSSSMFNMVTFSPNRQAVPHINERENIDAHDLPLLEQWRNRHIKWG